LIYVKRLDVCRNGDGLTLTIGSAYPWFEESIKGSIEPSKLADLVVWSHEIYNSSRREPGELKPLATIVVGKVVQAFLDGAHSALNNTVIPWMAQWMVWNRHFRSLAVM
jgi:hypothetical protein